MGLEKPVFRSNKNGFGIEKNRFGIGKKLVLGSEKTGFGSSKKKPVLRSDNWSTEYLTSLRLGEVFIC